MSERLILHHTYDAGIAFDVSEHGNHGELYGGVGPAGGPFGGSMQFFTGDSSIRVRPSATLSDLRSVRVRVRFLYAPLAGSVHRHNLAEGHLAFALFVNPDGSLQGTIVDGTGAWTGPITPPGVILPNVWHDVEFHHDGISRARLWVGGALLAERFDIPGPVRAVQNDGLAIGHWPHPDNRYSLEGYVDDIKIWGYDPEPDIRGLLDECCLDRAQIDALLHKRRAAGWNADNSKQLVRDVLDLATEIAAATRAGDPGRTAALGQLTRDGMLAVGRKDLPAFANTIEQVHNLMLGPLSQAQIVDYGMRALDQLQQSPIGNMLFDGRALDFDGARELAAMLCLEQLVPPDPKRDKPPPKRPRRPDGDPDTDRPDGKPPSDWNTGVNEPPRDEPGHGEPERPDKPERPDRPERPDKPERPDSPDHSDDKDDDR